MKRKIEQKECGAAANVSLAELPVGAKATITSVAGNARGGKKFADVGIIRGAEISVEADAPFGGLMRVRVMGTSMALHRNDAKCVFVSAPGVAGK